MSSASPGAERAALAILLRRRRSCSEAMSNTCVRILVRVACSASFAAGMGKSNRRSTRRPVSALKKYALAGASRRSRMAATLRLADRRGHLSHVVQTRDELESTVVEESDRTSKTVAWMRDHEIEVTRHSARSQHHKGHASHEHWLEAEGAETLDNFADRLEMIPGSGISRSRGIDPWQRTGESAQAPDSDRLPAKVAERRRHIGNCQQCGGLPGVTETEPCLPATRYASSPLRTIACRERVPLCAPMLWPSQMRS